MVFAILNFNLKLELVNHFIHWLTVVVYRNKLKINGADKICITIEKI